MNMVLNNRGIDTKKRRIEDVAEGPCSSCFLIVVFSFSRYPTTINNDKNKKRKLFVFVPGFATACADDGHCSDEIKKRNEQQNR